MTLSEMKQQYSYYEKINRLAQENRRNGHTTWLINSLLYSPNVIVVCRDEKSARELEKQYIRTSMLDGISPIDEIFLSLKNSNFKPRFVTVDTRITSSDIPIIFENHTLQYYPTVTNENFRSERQMKLFAILVGIWMSYGEVANDEIDSHVRESLIEHCVSQAKEYHFKDGWQNCTNYKDLKQWYLGSKSEA